MAFERRHKEIERFLRILFTKTVANTAFLYISDFQPLCNEQIGGTTFIVRITQTPAQALRSHIPARRRQSQPTRFFGHWLFQTKGLESASQSRQTLVPMGGARLQPSASLLRRRTAVGCKIWFFWTLRVEKSYSTIATVF